MSDISAYEDVPHVPKERKGARYHIKETIRHSHHLYQDQGHTPEAQERLRQLDISHQFED